MVPFQPRLALPGATGEPIWCSMCGQPLTAADHPFSEGDGWACQCELCRIVLEACVRRIMERHGVDCDDTP